MITDIVEQFMQFEMNSNLYAEDDISWIWKYSRMDIYYEITRQKGVFQHVRDSAKVFDIIRLLPRIIKALVLHRISNAPEGRIFVFEHPRAKIINEEAVDPYTYFIDNNEEVVRIDKTTPDKPSKQVSGLRYTNDYIEIRKRFVCKRNSLSNDLQIKIKHLSEILHGIFSIDASILYKIMNKNACRFLDGREYYTKLFRDRKVKSIYIADHYSRRADIIYAAKNLDIPVIEYQHGIISAYHMGYSVCDIDKRWVGYPDVFMSWGDEWLNGVKLPKTVNVLDIKPPHLDIIYDKKLKHKQILVVSQGVIGKQLAKSVVENIRRFDGYNIVFKMHPSEFSRKQEYIDYFAKNEVDCEVKLEDDIYELMRESSVVLGVFSTAMIESVSYGCDVYYFDLPGSEYVENNNKLKSIDEWAH